MPEKKPKPISFTQYERTCKFHVKGEDKVCYCSETGNICNKEECLRFNKGKGENDD
jgi:hypothetical protein